MSHSTPSSALESSGLPPRDGLGWAGRVARAFIDSKLTPLVIIASILLGLAATILLPREEEPQIKVPMIDVMVSMPGFSAKEVEERATRPMEKLLWEIPGVEYLYSLSRPGQSLVIVRFKVGEDVERSLVKLNQKLQSHYDRIPAGVSFPLIKPKSIDDVPILALTFHSARYDHEMLRRLAAEVDDAVKQVPQVSQTSLIGGAQRQVRIQLDPARLASRGLTPAGIIPKLLPANRQSASGPLTTADQTWSIETGGFFSTAQEVGALVVGNDRTRPVYLRDVAEILDGAADPDQYVFFGLGAAQSDPATPLERPAVTLSIAKRPGANAIAVANEVLRKVEALRGYLIPSDVEMTITRHYGATASEKSNELLLHMAIAIVSVSLLVLFALGWRESLIVAIAIPATLALTLLVFYLYGFTLNRITLFALIFSIGILVDDAIVVVENIARHQRLHAGSGQSLSSIAVTAVNEVGNPTILATFAVIFAVVPMAFVGGLMGPYMRPIPIGAGAAMFFSLLIAFIVTPWAAVRLLRRHPPTPADSSEPAGASGEDVWTRIYRRVMRPLLHDRLRRWLFLSGVCGLLLIAMGMVALGWVQVKMLPFDNKSEFQIILNMPENSSLERTARAAREIAQMVAKEPEVTDYQVYAGISAPFNFNGLVRHYDLRRGPAVADVQINLVKKHRRDAQSHDIAKRIRPQATAIAARYGARVAIAEVPPGPPVLQTLVAEVYGPTAEDRHRLASKVREIFLQTGGVVDVDWLVEADQPKARFVIDKEKAALHGISAETISQTLRIAVAGLSVDLLHQPTEKEDVTILLEVARRHRRSPEELLALRVRSGDANALPENTGSPGGSPLVPLRELVRIELTTEDKTIYRKNLMPVSYVLGDVAGVTESPVYAILEMNRALRRLDSDPHSDPNKPRVATPQILNASQPFHDLQPALKWDGEWHITLEVFRDLGLAFGAVLILIYVLMVGWFRSFLTPLVVMAAIPFSLVGILPGHALMGAFFTATSMIGFMAGAGIVVRNSIILVDFIKLRRSQGLPLDQAVIEAGAVRFRPMFLTAMAVVVGAGVILFDPIFQGLAISLMAGEVASLFISRMAVPVLYYLAFKDRLDRPA